MFRRRQPVTIMNLFSKVIRRFKTQPEPMVIVHDPAAAEPHNLDDPFWDEKVQERMGAAISKSTGTEPR